MPKEKTMSSKSKHPKCTGGNKNRIQLISREKKSLRKAVKSLRKALTFRYENPEYFKEAKKLVRDRNQVLQATYQWLAEVHYS
jgi:hypothetical protein